MIKPVVRCHLEPVKHDAKGLAAYIGDGAEVMIGDVGYGEMEVTTEMLPMMVTRLRSFHGIHRSSQVRQVIASPAIGSSKKESWELVKAICRTYMQKYAPGHPWLLGFHATKKPYHGHLGFSTVGPDGKALKFGKKEFLAIQNLEFTSLALPSKGRGRTKGVRVHATAKNLDSRDLAHDLLNPGGDFRSDVWKAMRQSRTIDRLRTTGPRTFVFQYKRHKVTREISTDTLRHFLTEESRRRRTFSKRIETSTPPPVAATPPPALLPASSPISRPPVKAPPIVQVPQPPPQTEVEVTTRKRPLVKAPATPSVLVSDLPETEVQMTSPSRPIVKVPTSLTGANYVPPQTTNAEPPQPLPKRPLVKVPPVTPPSEPPLPSDDESPDI